MLAALANYVACILTDGDYLNDWLTHLPHAAQPVLIVLGHLIALLIGA